MKKTKKHLIGSMMILIISAVVMMTMNGCNKPGVASPILPGNEFLTTTILVVTDPANPAFHDTAIWSKNPPNGLQAPDTAQAFLHLQANHTYNLHIGILDSTQTPPFNVGQEIDSLRANYHLFCFNTSSGLNLSVTPTDHDGNTPPLPVGFYDSFMTGGASTGTLEVILHHQPNVKNGQCAPGSIDLDVTYQIVIQ
jgi:hypothetical protein